MNEFNREKSLRFLTPQPDVNYDPATKEGRKNVLVRIFIDNNIPFDEKYLQNGLHWILSAFKAGREYQLTVDKHSLRNWTGNILTSKWSGPHNPEVGEDPF